MVGARFSGMATDSEDTKSMTFTYNMVTERALREAYPHALGISERIRMAINDALDDSLEVHIEIEDVETTDVSEDSE